MVFPAKTAGAEMTTYDPAKEIRYGFPGEKETKRRNYIFGALTNALQLGAKMSDLAASLGKICEVTLDLEMGSRITKFCYGEVVVTIRVVFADQQSGAEMAITNMTTLPYSQTGKGYGSKALHTLLEWAQGEGLTKIVVVQVQAQSEKFWKKNAFVALRNATNDFKYMPPT